MKKHVALILAVVMMVSLLPFSVFAADKITVTLNDKEVAFPDAQAFVNKDNRTMVPLSPIASAMNLTVAWDEAKQTATFAKEYTSQSAIMKDTADNTHTGDYYMAKESLSFTIGSKSAVYTTTWYDTTDAEMKTPLEKKAFTKTVAMDTSVLQQNQRVYAPVKYLAETFGYEVFWDEEENTVILKTGTGDYATVWQLLGNSAEYNAYGLFQARFYEQLTSKTDPNPLTKLEIVSAKLDDKAATIRIFGDTEKETLLTESGEDSTYLTGFYLDAKLEPGKTYTITVTLRYTYANGYVTTSEAPITYTASDGYGGIL